MYDFGLLYILYDTIRLYLNCLKGQRTIIDGDVNNNLYVVLCQPEEGSLYMSRNTLR